jgi:hypothetical protein
MPFGANRRRSPSCPDAAGENAPCLHGTWVRSTVDPGVLLTLSRARPSVSLGGECPTNSFSGSKSFAKVGIASFFNNHGCFVMVSSAMGGLTERWNFAIVAVPLFLSVLSCSVPMRTFPVLMPLLRCTCGVCSCFQLTLAHFLLVSCTVSTPCCFTFFQRGFCLPLAERWRLRPILSRASKGLTSTHSTVAPLSWLCRSSGRR